MADLRCEKCRQGAMAPRRVYRLSGRLVAIGYTLLALSFGSALMGCLLGGPLVRASGATGGAAVARDLTAATAARLEEFRVPAGFISEFEQRRTITPQMLDTLPGEQRERVELMLMAQQSARGGADLASSAVGLAGTDACAAAFLTAVPAFIVGLLLVRRRSVLACPTCGFALDGAE